MRLLARIALLLITLLVNITLNASLPNHFNYIEGKTRHFSASSTISSSEITPGKTSGDWDPVEDVTAEVKKKILEIKAIEKLVSSERRLVEKLDEFTTMEYPVGISKTIGNLNYIMLLNRDVITPQGGTIEAYMSFRVPQSSDSLTFAATGIPLSATGGFSGDIKLSLLSSSYIMLGNNIRLKIVGGENKSFVTFNCNGFKNMTIVGELEFAKSVFLPENPVTGEVIPNKTLKTEFTLTTENWNNLMVEVSLDPFQIQGIQGFGFEAKRVVVDFSDYTNPVGITFPSSYQSTYFASESPNLWRGLYIQQATVRLPSEFNNSTGSNTPQRTSITANNLIIDKMGVTGNFSVNHLIDFGDMNGWGFTVEKFGMALEANSIKEASFSGKVTVPMLDSALNYAATIGMDGDYSFSASTSKANKFSLWAADLTLNPNSTIKIKKVNGKFLPEAILHGELVINASLNGSGSETDKSKSVSIADIKFQDLHLQTVKPYVQVGSFSFGSEQANQMMAGFPLQIKEIGVSLSGDELALKLRIVVNIADGGFGADGTFRIVAQQKQNDKWRFKGVEIEQLSINMQVGPLKMKGFIAFFRNDTAFGNGFQGAIEAEFSMGIKLQSNAMFGKVRGMRYWYVDAQAELPVGIPIFTGLAIYGFGGGAYYHMKQAGFATASDKFGKTMSGLVYKPDAETGIGLKAMVIIGCSPKKEIFNGDAGFEIAFNSGGGVRFICFTGHAAFLTPPIPNVVKAIADGAEKIGAGKEAVSSDPDNRGCINASLLLSYDFSSSTLHGQLKTFVNIAGIITGIGPNNSAGEAVLHYSPEEWYIYIGTPDNPIGLQFMGIAETRSYFMMGTNIPSSPAPPAEVFQILGSVQTDYMKDLNALGQGKGVTFGSSFKVNMDGLSFDIFYASFKAGLGFDVMLKDYGNTTCKGSTSPIGIQGWYANGQAYAYMEGSIGIRVKIFGKSKSIHILDIAAATLLQAKLPNPTWLYGAVGGRFSVLGGVVKGQCRFEFSIGEECKLADSNSALKGVEIISEVTPANAQKEVSVFNAPQAIFNYAVEKPFELMDIDNVSKQYRIKLDYFELSDGSNSIECKMEWNADHNVLALKPTDILPGEKQYKAKVGVSFEEYVNGNWTPVYEKSEKFTESKEVGFETGAAPDFIPPSNVQFSYPIINQFNYYKDETSLGYVKLRQGQDYLFDPMPEIIPKGRFVSLTTGQKIVFDFSYDKTANEITFQRPDGLNNGEAYRMELVNMPANATKAIDANVKAVSTNSSEVGSGSEVTTTTQEAEGELTDVKEKVFYASLFRTSKHNTFKSKMQAFVNSSTYLDYVKVSVESLLVYSQNSEPFDVFEKYGNMADFKPLVKAEAQLDNNSWFINLVYPRIYKDYPFGNGIEITNRNVSVLGIPPSKAIDLFQMEPYTQISDDMAAQEIMMNKTTPLIAYEYNIPSAVDADVFELKCKAANSVAHGAPLSSTISSMLEYTPSLLTRGDYYVNVSYQLPGKDIVTSTVPLNMKIR